MLYGENEDGVKFIESSTAKWIGIGLLAAGVGMGAYALIKGNKKKTSKGGKLNGVSRKRLTSGKRRHAKKVNF